MQRSLFSSYVLSNNKAIFHPSSRDLPVDSDDDDTDDEEDIFSRAGQSLSEPIPTISARVAAAETGLFGLARQRDAYAISLLGSWQWHNTNERFRLFSFVFAEIT